MEAVEIYGLNCNTSQWKINALLASRLGLRFLHWVHYTYLITCINTIHNGQYTVTLINNVVIVCV